MFNGIDLRVIGCPLSHCSGRPHLALICLGCSRYYPWLKDQCREVDSPQLRCAWHTGFHSRYAGLIDILRNAATEDSSSRGPVCVRQIHVECYIQGIIAGPQAAGGSMTLILHRKLHENLVKSMLVPIDFRTQPSQLPRTIHLLVPMLDE